MRNIWASNRMCRVKEFRFCGKEDGDPEGFASWSIFQPDTTYFQPSTKPFMLNFRVEGLDGLREKLRGGGVWIDPDREDYDTGDLPGSWTRKETGLSCGDRRDARERIGSC